MASLVQAHTHCRLKGTYIRVKCAVPWNQVLAGQTVNVSDFLVSDERGKGTAGIESTCI